MSKYGPDHVWGFKSEEERRIEELEDAFEEALDNRPCGCPPYEYCEKCEWMEEFK